MSTQKHRATNYVCMQNIELINDDERCKIRLSQMRFSLEIINQTLYNINSV